MRRRAIKDTRHEAAQFLRRALASFSIIFLALAILGIRFWYLQVARA